MVVDILWEDVFFSIAEIHFQCQLFVTFRGKALTGFLSLGQTVGKFLSNYSKIHYFDLTSHELQQTHFLFLFLTQVIT